MKLSESLSQELNFELLHNIGLVTNKRKIQASVKDSFEPSKKR